jgi:hypothetical protein
MATDLLSGHYVNAEHSIFDSANPPSRSEPNVENKPFRKSKWSPPPFPHSFSPSHSIPHLSFSIFPFICKNNLQTSLDPLLCSCADLILFIIRQKYFTYVLLFVCLLLGRFLMLSFETFAVDEGNQQPESNPRSGPLKEMGYGKGRGMSRWAN